MTVQAAGVAADRETTVKSKALPTFTWVFRLFFERNVRLYFKNHGGTLHVETLGVSIQWFHEADHEGDPRRNDGGYEKRKEDCKLINRHQC